MSRLGCYIVHIFVVALCYADDMHLLRLIRKGLQNLTDICKQFDVNYIEKNRAATYMFD